MDSSARITSKGQVTIPKSVRDALGLHGGDELLFRVEQSRAVIAKTPGFLELAGSVRVPADAALPIGERFPPGPERLGVVRAGDRDGHMRKFHDVAGNAEIVFPAQHFRSRHLLGGERAADEIGHRAEILGEHLGLFAEEREDPLALLALPRLVAGDEEGRALVDGQSG